MPRILRDRVSLYTKEKKYARQVSEAEARKMIAQGVAVPMTRGLTGELPGWQERAGYPLNAVMLSTHRIAQSDPAAITKGEMMAAAGCFDSGRATPQWVLDAKEKVAAWPFVGDDKAVRVGIRA